MTYYTPFNKFVIIVKKMEKPIQLIWDFRGQDALKTAEHQAIHLKEFIEKENHAIDKIGFEEINEIHAIAYIVVTTEQMRELRDVLKPHRGVYYNKESLLIRGFIYLLIYFIPKIFFQSGIFASSLFTP